MKQSVTIEKTRRLPPLGLRGLFPRTLQSAGVSLSAFVLLFGERLYAGRIPGTGGLSLGALAAVFPLLLLALALAVWLGKAKGKEAGRLQALGKEAEAREQLGGAFGLLILLGLLLTAGAWLLDEPLLRLCGAGEEGLSSARDYIRLASLGSIFFLLTWGGCALLAAQDRKREGGIILAIAALTKLIFDPILILVLGLGLRGAAVSSLAVYAISALLMTLALVKRTALIYFEASRLLPGLKSLKTGLSQVVPALLALAGEGLVMAVLNRRLAQEMGETALGVLAVLTALLALFFLPLYGLAKGAKPLIQACFAKGDTEGVKRASGQLLALSLGFSLLFWLAVQLKPQLFLRIFGLEEKLIALAAPLLRLFSAGAFLMGLQTSLRQTLSSVGAEKNLPAPVPPRSRLVILALLLLLPAFSGKTSKTALILLAQPMADFVAAAFALTLFFCGFNRALEEGPIFAERRQGRFFRFLRLVLIVFTPRMETTWEEPFSGAPSIFVCNHDRAFGPIAMCVHFPLCRELRPWINAQVLSPRETPQYVREDYWWDPDKWTAPLYSHSLAYLMALVLPAVLRGADSVPVYHDAAVMSTLRGSVKTLSDGKHLLLFPEKPTGYHQYDTKISDGFVSIGRLYSKRSSQPVHFYPAFVDWKGKKITVGKPLVYESAAAYDGQASRIAAEIEAYFAVHAQQENLESQSRSNNS